MSDFVTREYLIEQYVVQKKSFGCIAKEFNTYPNKIRRAAIQFGIKPRDKSVAQKEALKSGRHKHPTKGERRSDDVRIKISDQVAASWSNLTEEEYNKRVERSREQWKSMSLEDKKALRQAAAKAVRKTSKEGSKLERFVLGQLRTKGYVVQFHRKGLVLNERLEVDLFLPELKTAIEIDGPSHFYPIWGEQSLAKNLSSDAQKSGLLLSNGFALLRVKHLSKHVSNKHMRDLTTKIVEKLEEIKIEFPKEDKRLIEIEV